MAHDPRLVKSEDAIAELKQSIPDWIKTPGTAGDAVHRSRVRAARRHSRGRHRCAGRAALYRHQARRIRRRGDPCRASRRRRVPLYRAALDARPAAAWLRRGRGHEEQTVDGTGSQAGARHRAADGAVEDLGRLDGIPRRPARSNAPGSPTNWRCGQPEPRHRAGQHLRAIRQGGVSRPAGLRRASRRPMAA